MTSANPDMSYDDILLVLTEQAKTLWGEDRAQALSSSLAQTARELADVNPALPDREVEPGFYQ